MCVKCKHRVFYDPTTKVLYYMDDGCNKVPLPANALAGGVPIGGGATPSLPPDDELPAPSSGIACYKANALWHEFEAFSNALVLQWSDSSDMVIGYAAFQANYAHLDADNWQLFNFFKNHGADNEATLSTKWAEHKADLKELFICWAQDQLGKEPTLSDAEIDLAKTYDFDTDTALLDDFLTDVWAVIERKALKERASQYIIGEQGECNCAGSEPAPDPDVTPSGCISLKLVEFTEIFTASTIAGTSPDDHAAHTDIPPIYGSGSSLPFLSTSNTSDPVNGWQHGVRSILKIDGDYAGWTIRRIEVSFYAFTPSGVPQMDYVLATAATPATNFTVRQSGTTVTVNPYLASDINASVSHLFVGIGINTAHNVPGESRISNITIYAYPNGLPAQERTFSLNQNACAD